MIITFCGHSQFTRTEEYEQKILAFLEEKVGDNPADFYLGGYGSFDSFAYDCCKKYKAIHPGVSLIFITPYMTVEYQQNHLEYQKTRYDEIIYPEIEDKPPRFAITYRIGGWSSKPITLSAVSLTIGAELIKRISTPSVRKSIFSTSPKRSSDY